jgi:acyl-coenzyme A thioesterase PaaI-like protein
VTVEKMNARGAGRLPGLVGFRVMAIEEGLLVAEIDIRPDLVAPNGYLHAATVVALADTAAGMVASCICRQAPKTSRPPS